MTAYLPGETTGLPIWRGILFTSYLPQNLAALRAFLARTPACTAAVLAYNGKQAVKLGDRLWAIPISQLLA